MDYKTKNDRIVLSPHASEGINDPEAMQFWFKEAALIEKNSQKFKKSISFLNNFLVIEKRTKNETGNLKNETGKNFWLVFFTSNETKNESLRKF